MEELSERQRNILKVLIAEHVATAQPVGSEAVARKLALPVSTATIRNEMAELEERGYLYHPHTSAGRLPSEKGYRYFVESLLEGRELASDTRLSIRRRFHLREAAPEEWVDMAAEQLASTTRNAALISTPRAAESRLKHLQIVCVSDMLALLVLVFNDGTLRQQFVPFAEGLTQDDASAIANHLNARLGGLSSQQVQAVEEPFTAPETAVVDVVLRIMRQVDERRFWDLHYDGLSYMLAQPEFERGEKVRRVLELLSERRTLAELMVEASSGDRPRVIIGGEANAPFSLRECSLVIGRYGGENEVGGVLAVLGPMRMEYDRAISSVRYFASLLNEMLSELYGWKAQSLSVGSGGAEAEHGSERE